MPVFQYTVTERAATTEPENRVAGKVKASDLKLFTIFKRYDPVFTGLADACANYLQVDKALIKDKTKINGCKVFEVE